jgi:carboxylesterase type B
VRGDLRLDLPYTFGTLDHPGWAGFARDDPQAGALSASLRAAWAAFAHGEPPSIAGAEWESYGPPRRARMLLDDVCRVSDDPCGDVLALWDDVLTAG